MPATATAVLDKGPQKMPGTMLPFHRIRVEREEKEPDAILGKEAFDRTGNRENGEVILVRVRGTAGQKERIKCRVRLLSAVRVMEIPVVENRKKTNHLLLGPLGLPIENQGPEGLNFAHISIRFFPGFPPDV
jgi:hypothetical protein